MAIDLLKLEKKFIDLFQNTTQEEFEEWLLSKEREKETTRIQKYTIQISHYADGTSQMHRENNGFSVIELMGILEIVKGNLLEVSAENLFKDAITEVNEVSIKSNNSPLIHKK